MCIRDRHQELADEAVHKRQSDGRQGDDEEERGVARHGRGQPAVLVDLDVYKRQGRLPKRKGRGQMVSSQPIDFSRKEQLPTRNQSLRASKHHAPGRGYGQAEARESPPVLPQKYLWRRAGPDYFAASSLLAALSSSVRFSGRSCGKRMTSRMEVEPVSIIVSRSIPMPSPPVGGIP